MVSNYTTHPKSTQWSDCSMPAAGNLAAKIFRSP